MQEPHTCIPRRAQRRLKGGALAPESNGASRVVLELPAAVGPYSTAHLRLDVLCEFTGASRDRKYAFSEYFDDFLSRPIRRLRGRPRGALALPLAFMLELELGATYQAAERESLGAILSMTAAGAEFSVQWRPALRSAAISDSAAQAHLSRVFRPRAADTGFYRRAERHAELRRSLRRDRGQEQCSRSAMR